MKKNEKNIINKIYKTYIDFLYSYLSYESVSKYYEYLDEILPSWKSMEIHQKVLLGKDMSFLYDQIEKKVIKNLNTEFNENEDLIYEAIDSLWDIFDWYFEEEFVPFVKKLGFSRPWREDKYIVVDLSDFSIGEVFVIDEKAVKDRIEDYKEEIVLILLEHPDFSLEVTKLVEYLLEEEILSDEVGDFLQINPSFLKKISEIDTFLENTVLYIEDPMENSAHNFISIQESNI